MCTNHDILNLISRIKKRINWGNSIWPNWSSCLCFQLTGTPDGPQDNINVEIQPRWGCHCPIPLFSPHLCIPQPLITTTYFLTSFFTRPNYVTFDWPWCHLVMFILWWEPIKSVDCRNKPMIAMYTNHSLSFPNQYQFCLDYISSVCSVSVK